MGLPAKNEGMDKISPENLNGKNGIQGESQGIWKKFPMKPYLLSLL